MKKTIFKRFSALIVIAVIAASLLVPVSANYYSASTITSGQVVSGTTTSSGYFNKWYKLDVRNKTTPVLVIFNSYGSNNPDMRVKCYGEINGSLTLISHKMLGDFVVEETAAYNYIYFNIFNQKSSSYAESFYMQANILNSTYSNPFTSYPMLQTKEYNFPSGTGVHGVYQVVKESSNGFKIKMTNFHVYSGMVVKVYGFKARNGSFTYLSQTQVYSDWTGVYAEVNITGSNYTGYDSFKIEISSSSTPATDHKMDIEIIRS